MAAVPKPSQAKNMKSSNKVNLIKEEKKKKPKKNIIISYKQAILSLAKSSGGLTALEVRSECRKYKLSQNTTDHYVSDVRKEGLLKEEEKKKVTMA